MTFQVRETLIYRSRRRRIRALPLERCGRPVPNFGVMSSGCWRGYEGTWEVRDDALHLVRVAAPHGQGSRDGLARTFPGHAGPVEGTWFSGEIVPDDVANPEDRALVELGTSQGRPPQFLWFTLVVHRGKLLLEEAVDLKGGARQTRLTQHASGLFPGPELPFLHAIQANADDPTPKLVYADWLDERDDPRGPLLRAEVARSQEEGPRRAWAERNYRQDIPSGYVPPEDLIWYWRRAAGVPEMTPEDLAYRRLLGRPG
jgi:uncharacterized protein (TIGR02996 family)